MVINVNEAKTHLSRLIDRAAAGEELVLGKHGKPLARLVPYRRRTTPRRPGRLRGAIRVSDDFDDTESWMVAAFEGEAPTPR